MECLKQALLFTKINDEYIEDIDIEDYFEVKLLPIK